MARELVSVIVILLLAVGCGDAGDDDAGPPSTDAGMDSAVDAGADAGFDASPDPPDAGFDATGFDAGHDASTDAGVDAAMDVCGAGAIAGGLCGEVALLEVGPTAGCASVIVCGGAGAFDCGAGRTGPGILLRNLGTEAWSLRVEPLGDLPIAMYQMRPDSEACDACVGRTGAGGCGPGRCITHSRLSTSESTIFIVIDDQDMPTMAWHVELCAPVHARLMP